MVPEGQYSTYLLIKRLQKDTRVNMSKTMNMYTHKKCLSITGQNPAPSQEGGYLQEKLSTQEERENKLVPGKQRSAHVFVEVVLKVVSQVADTALQYLGFIAANTACTH